MASTTESSSTASDRSTQLQTQARTSERESVTTPGTRTTRETPGGQKTTTKVLPRLSVSFEFERV